MEEVAGPCDVLTMDINDQIAAETPRIDASDVEQASLLASLKALKDEGNAQTPEMFSSLMRAMFDAVKPTYPAVATGIVIPSVPTVC